MRQTQCDTILKLLKDGELHSSLEMRNEFYIMQPATRIFELKEEKGHNIKTKMLPANRNNPYSPKIAWYRLIPNEDN